MKGLFLQDRLNAASGRAAAISGQAAHSDSRSGALNSHVWPPR